MEPRDGLLRYLVQFADGGAGMRFFDHRLEPGDELTDCGDRYRIVRVEQHAGTGGFGHAWAEPGRSDPM